MPIDPNNLSGTAAMTFDDEFNSLSLWNGTSGTWTTTYPFADPTGAGSTLASNGEQEWYINSNYAPTASVTPWTVANGDLHLIAAPAPASIQPLIDNYQYTSGQLNTVHSFSQTYGYFEVRAELPAGQGMWPAFWLMPSNGAWPPELDVMEVLGNSPTTLYTTVHTASTGVDTQQSVATTAPDTSTGFHTYGVDWEPDYITWYFDGKAIDRVATPSDMNSPMYMLLNLAVGGSWPGDVNGTTPFPADMTVDWVRAYQAIPNAAAPTLSPSTAVAATGSGDVLSAAGASHALAGGGAATSAAMLSNGGIAVGGAQTLANGGGFSGIADLYSASGAPSGGDVALTGWVGTPSGMDPQVTALPGGYWEITYAGAGAPATTEIYNSSGTLTFLENAFTTGSPVFTTLSDGSWVEASDNAPGRFEIVQGDGQTTWLALPTINGAQPTPSAVTTLGDGGFVFAYAGSTELDRFSANGGVHTTMQLASAPVSAAPGVAGFTDGVTEAAWLAAGANGTTSLRLESFGALGQVNAAAVTLAPSVDATSEIRVLGTGVHDQSLVLWSSGGTVYGAAFDGTTASAATALASGALDGVQSAVLTDGDVALTWLETDNGVQHQWVEVVDPSTLQATRHDLGAADGSAHLAALQGGGFAESWHAGAETLGIVYDGLGDYGATSAVAGDFVGVNSQGQLLAVATGGNGPATLQAYDLGGTPSSGGAPAESAGFTDPHDFLGDARSQVLMENADNGEVYVGEGGADGQLSWTQVAQLGSEWRFAGDGDFLGQGHDQFLILNSNNGALDVGAVANGQATWTQVGQLGAEWSLQGAGSYLGDGTHDFLLQNADNGDVDVGSVMGGPAQYAQVAQLGAEWKITGSGDFLGQGHDQLLMVNAHNGDVDVGAVANGQTTWTQVAQLGAEWTIEGAGDYLGDGKSQFLMENANNGAVVAGEVGANGQASWTQVAQLGPEWKFVGSADVLGQGHDQFILQNTANGEVAAANVVGGHAQFARIGGLGSEWSFHM